ncbi:MAG: MMPL family transporter [Gordonibacter pamelaeae]
MAQLKGSDRSLMMISTTLPVESPETTAFLERLAAQLDQRTDGAYYLMGTSVMGYEVLNSFADEMLFITLLTACVIFLVVALTFRSPASFPPSWWPSCNAASTWYSPSSPCKGAVRTTWRC